MLWRDGTGEWQRLDALADEPLVPPPGPVAGWWVHEVRDGSDPEVERRKRWQASAEEVFLNWDETAGGEAGEALRCLLALQLERKRRLKPVGRAIGGVQEYRHPRSGRVFRVAMVQLGPAEWAQLAERLDQLLG